MLELAARFTLAATRWLARACFRLGPGGALGETYVPPPPPVPFKVRPPKSKVPRKPSAREQRGSDDVFAEQAATNYLLSADNDPDQANYLLEVDLRQEPDRRLLRLAGRIRSAIRDRTTGSKGGKFDDLFGPEDDNDFPISSSAIVGHFLQRNNQSYDLALNELQDLEGRKVIPTQILDEAVVELAARGVLEASTTHRADPFLVVDTWGRFDSETNKLIKAKIRELQGQ